MTTLQHQDTFDGAYNPPAPVTEAGIVPRRRRSIGSVDSIIDEENINWWVFFTRVFLLILVVLIIVTLGLEDLNPSFIFLSVFLCAFLILCLVATFVDMSCLWKCCKTAQPQLPSPPVDGTTGTATTSPPEFVDTESPIQSTNAFGNYHNRL